MLWLSLLLFLPLLSTVTAQDNMTVDGTCEAGPVYIFIINSPRFATGVIFIDGLCSPQVTSNATSVHMFNGSDCNNGTAPALGTVFTVVIRQYIDISLDSDFVYDVTCNLLTSVVQHVTIGTVGSIAGIGNLTLKPTITTSVLDSSGNPVTTGSVGDVVQIKLNLINPMEAALLDYEIEKLAVTAYFTSIDIINGGCTQYPGIIDQQSARVDGESTLNFQLFIPIMPGMNPSGDSPTPVTYSFTIYFCESSCGVPECLGRKKRSDSPFNSTSVDVSTSIIVYPPGHTSAVANQFGDEVVVFDDDDDDVCLSRSSLVGIMSGLTLAMVICITISSLIFCRLRSVTNKGDPPYVTKHSY